MRNAESCRALHGPPRIRRGWPEEAAGYREYLVDPERSRPRGVRPCGIFRPGPVLIELAGGCASAREELWSRFAGPVQSAPAERHVLPSRRSRRPHEPFPHSARRAPRRAAGRRLSRCQGPPARGPAARFPGPITGEGCTGAGRSSRVDGQREPGRHTALGDAPPRRRRVAAGPQRRRRGLRKPTLKSASDAGSGITRSRKACV